MTPSRWRCSEEEWAAAWYAELRELGNRYVAVQFRQSQNERWIQLRLNFTSPLAQEGSRRLGDRWWRVLTVETPRLLELAPAIAANVVFASESAYEREIPADAPPVFEKHVELVFSRETLAAAYFDIRTEVVQVLETIADEVDLLMQDSLARGRLVRFGGVFAKQHDGKWFADRDSFRSAVGADDPPEFWAHVPIPAGQVLTETCFYPWMPTPVSAGGMNDLQPT